MSQIPYSPVYGKMKAYFDRFQEAGIPDKVTNKWLESLGFRSTNDRYMVKVLRFIGFIDKSNTPTDLWRDYKDPKKAGAVLAEGIRTGFKELFELYEDAHRKDREAIYAFFSSKTGKAKTTVDYMVNTFINLCQLADFEAEVPKKKPKAPRVEVGEERRISIKPERGVISEMHINIQLHLPATNDSTVYDALFRSLRKNLLSGEE